jgi:GDPmannose 4,6-dehydratase
VRKRALITGITGQDGSYLTELLLSKDYEIHGLKRRSSSFNTGRIDQVLGDWHQEHAPLRLHFADLTDSTSLIKVLHEVRPHEVYHLGAQSHVRVSFDIPEYTGDITAIGTTRILEAMRVSGISAKFYNAASSEMFGNAPVAPQNELTPFHPCSPYGCAKLYSYWMTANYRSSYAMFACNGILFNHESPRRGETFVSRKISRAVARIRAGVQEKLYMGNLDARRDWGYAPEYVEAMWKMLQREEPEDFVIATGEVHSVREFLEIAFGHVHLNWEDFVVVDPRYFRPTEVNLLQGDASKARRLLDWAPRIHFAEMVRLMVEADIKLVQDQLSGQHQRHTPQYTD